MKQKDIEVVKLKRKKVRKSLKIKKKNKNKINEIKINEDKGMSDIIPIKINKKEISSNLNINLNNNNLDNNKNKNNSFFDFNDTELNSLSYDDALNHDQRTYIQYYISLLKHNHLLIFSFYSNNDYNSRIIKMFLFFFCFASNLIINALFFSDATMHKIYSDKGDYDFIYNIPQIIYSLFISVLINSIIKFLSLSEKKVLKLKEEKRNISEDLDKKIEKLFKVLKIKFTLFFIITFIVLIIYWFYITCFCAIYKNTQIYLIKDTVSSFLTSFVSPFGLFLLPGIFRKCALKAVKKDKKLLYKFSQLLENL